MKISTIFIVIERGGEYDDKWETNRSAWMDYTAAEQEVTRLKAEKADHIAKIDELRQWMTDNHVAFEKSPSEGMKHVPRWAPGLAKEQITDAMRAERNEIEAHNAAVRARYLEEQIAWNEVALVRINEKRVELGLNPVNDIYNASGSWNYKEHTEFEIEELDLHT